MNKTRGLHWAWIILGTCFVNVFISYSARLGYGVVLPEMIRDLGFGRTAGGSIYNAYLICYIALTPLTGFLTDRLGARRVIAVCALILGIGLLTMGTVRTVWTACLAFGIVGLGATGMWTPVITVVQRWFIPARRGLALGILSAGYGAGFAVIGLVFPLIVLHYNWSWVWYFLGGGALLMVGVDLVLLRSSPEASGYKPWGTNDNTAGPISRTPAVTREKALARVFRDKTFYIIGASYFCIAYSLYGITTFMVDYAKYQVGLPLEKASFLATIHGICQVFGVLTVMPLSDYLGRKRTILLSNAVITICLGGILFTKSSWLSLYVLVGIMAVFYGVTFPIYGACAGDYFPKEVMGTVIGAWTPFYGSGSILVHWVTGFIRDRTGSYDQAFLINAIMAGLGFLILLALDKKPTGS